MTTKSWQYSACRVRTSLSLLSQLSTIFIVAAGVTGPAQAQLKPETQQLMHRLFGRERPKAPTFGPARWLEGGASYTTLEASAGSPTMQDIVSYATATGERKVLVSAYQLVPPGGSIALNIEDYSWSADMAWLLIFTNSQTVWREHTRGDYWVLNRKSAKLRQLGGDAPASTLMFAKFSPDSKSVAYVRYRNLYVEDLASGAIRALTSDGSDSIINGTTDWVYEEELSLRDGFRWSPDSRQIAYWQFDTRGVANFDLTYDLGAPGEIVTGFPYPGTGRYPTHLSIPYPIAGTTNSAVRIGTVSATGGKTRWISVPGDPRENYIARAEWVPGSHKLAIEHLNRLENTNDVLLADVDAGSVKSIFRDQDDAWVDAMDSFVWLPDARGFLWLSERTGWRQIFQVSFAGETNAVTHGNFDVISLNGVDAKGGWIYFIASPENATQRYLYRVRLDGSGEADRVTPQDLPGTNSYDISPDGSAAFHTYSRADLPSAIDLVRLAGHERVRTLLDNSAEVARTASEGRLKTEFFRVDIGGGVTLDSSMLKPPGFDPAKKYPVLVFVYGEPFLQVVLDNWWNVESDIDRWFAQNSMFNHAAASEGYVVVSFDNRGTPAPKGRAWRKIVYGAIHPVIVRDQTAAIESLLKARSYLDASRVAVWGWSGGGSSTLNLMFRSPDVYKVGMAVAPVPELRLYDTIYQERYMGLPLQNVEGYKNSSAVNFAEGLKGHLLIVHGSGDDNVHYSGTELLLNRLIELGKPVDFMEYPSRTHCICEGAGTTEHLYSLLLRYLEEHMPPNP